MQSTGLQVEIHNSGHVFYYNPSLTKNLEFSFFFSELYFSTPTDWHQVRGAQMILSMKIISLGFDMDAYQPKGKLK